MKFFNAFLILNILFVSNLRAQNYFTLTDSTTMSFEESHIYHNNIYLSGAVYPDFLNGLVSVTLTKINLNGQILNVDTVSLDTTNVCYGSTFNFWKDKIVLFNNYNDTPPFNLINNNFQLSLLDTNFNVLWDNKWGITNKEERVSDILIHNNSFYLLGTTIDSSSTNGKVYFSKTDTLGNIIWEQFYDLTNKVDYAYKLKIVNDSLFVIYGSSVIDNFNKDMFLLFVDLNGNVLFQKQFTNPTNSSSEQMTLLKDNTILLSRCETDINNSNYTNSYLEKLNLNGDVIWSKQFQVSNYMCLLFSEPLEKPDGSIIIAANIKTDTVINSNYEMTRVYQINPFGDIMWYKDYFTNIYKSQYIYTILESPIDDGIILTGRAYPYNNANPFKQSGWLIKTNCIGEEGVQHPITNGCLAYDCNQYPIEANFMADNYLIDLATSSGIVTFTNTSSNTTNRMWLFGDGAVGYTDSIVSHTYTTPGTYEVKLIVYHSACSDTITKTIEVINSLDVNENKQNTIELFPNPTNDKVYINYNVSTTDNLIVNILDLQGKIIYSKNVANHNGQLMVDLSELSDGVYFVNLTTGIGVKTVKLIVTK